jgi:sigma-B regulation protein RsbU (phosphoserine phosphatase)
MWNIESTARLLKEISRLSDPAQIVSLFFDHIRRSIDVQRAIVLGNAGLSWPKYWLLQKLPPEPGQSGVFLNELRESGLLAQLLYRGAFERITNLSPERSDSAFDLLQGSHSLLAFPLFEGGANAGMVVVLSDCSHPHDAADLCALATMTSLLGRAIETQKLVNDLEIARRALDAELKAAADVQRWLLPSLPAVHNLDIAASYRTARYSGGDYYDVGQLPDGRLGVLIADVSGKGAAAAVLMAMLRSIVHDQVDRRELIGPAALLDYADARLRALGLSERSAFVTAFCGSLDLVTGELIYSSAGHNPPRVLRSRDRTVTSLDGAATFPLGLVDEPHSHTEETITLTPGDLALFYTDGITEARSPGGEFFGVERLDQLLCGMANPLASGRVIRAVTHAVAEFAAPGAPADDQTLVALGRSVH